MRTNGLDSLGRDWLFSNITLKRPEVESPGITFSPPVNLRYSPYPKQEVFHKSVKPVRLFVAGNRSGKSISSVAECLYYALGTHPYKVLPWKPPLLGRVVGVDFGAGIQKMLLPIFKRLTPPTSLVGGSWETGYAKQSKTLRFVNGSEIDFTSSDQELDAFAGTYRHFIMIDEECPRDVYIENKARLVDVNGHIWITMTPVLGMTWVYTDLYLPGLGITDPLLHETVPPNPNVEVIQAATTENPHIDAEALKEFQSDLDERQKKIRIGGEFVPQSGLVYPEFGDENILRLGDNPQDEDVRNWLRQRTGGQVLVGFDHGLRNPSAWTFSLVEEAGKVTTFYELYLTELTIDEVAKEYRDTCNRLNISPICIYGDPAIKARNAITGTSVIEEYANRGIGIVPANNDVAAGIERVRAAINNGWQVTNNCRHLLWEMQRYVWKEWQDRKLRDKQNAPDIPNKKDDHLLDAVRYMYANRPELMAKKVKSAKEKKLVDEWVLRRKKRDAWRIQARGTDMYLGQM